LDEGGARHHPGLSPGAQKHNGSLRSLNKIKSRVQRPPSGGLFVGRIYRERATTGSARCDTCLIVVTVANISAAQNAPINAENIKRGSITRSSLFLESPITAALLSGVNPLSFAREP
jgi:hypothetical protein